MRTVLISIAIGICAGALDIVPMIIAKTKKLAAIAAFIHYFIVSILIVNVDLFGIAWWLKGSVIAFALSLPTAVIVSEKDSKSVPVITLMSIVLGALIGLAGHFLV